MLKRVSAFLMAAVLAFAALPEAYGVEERDYITTLETVEANVPLEGTLVENAVIISVVLPAAVDIIVRVNNDGTFRRLYAPSSLYVTSRSDCPVALSLAEVRDTGGKLSAFDAFLSAYSTDGLETPLSPRVGPLAAGTYDVGLGGLAPLPADGVVIPENRLRLVLEGAANAADGPVGTVGETFRFETTLKVSAAVSGR